MGFSLLKSCTALPKEDNFATSLCENLGRAGLPPREPFNSQAPALMLIAGESLRGREEKWDLAGWNSPSSPL